MKILLGLTGSVATTLAEKTFAALSELGEVEVIITEAATHFIDTNIDPSGIGCSFPFPKTYTDADEWSWPIEAVNGRSEKCFVNKWAKDYPVLHIDLGKNSAALVIAPVTMNTIAKMAHGIADNLLTSVYAAWDDNRPVIIAPAMNERMWFSSTNQDNLDVLFSTRNVHVVDPIKKMLACGDLGMGAMANISDIVSCVKECLMWQFPLSVGDEFPGIPVGDHPGAFGNIRKRGGRHCGVDLYCKANSIVYAVEDGTIVDVEQFTGNAVGSPWWQDTWAVKVLGASGVVCYGEIEPYLHRTVGTTVHKGADIGRVIPVLPDSKQRPDIPGHSTSMLHFQLYDYDMIHKDHEWESDLDNPPKGILDPTRLLMAAMGSHGGTIKTIDYNLKGE